MMAKKVDDRSEAQKRFEEADAKAAALRAQLAELSATAEPDDLNEAAQRQMKINVLRTRLHDAGVELDAAGAAISAEQAEVEASERSRQMAFDRLRHNLRVFTGGQNAADARRAVEGAIAAGVDDETTAAFQGLLDALDRIEKLAV